MLVGLQLHRFLELELLCNQSSNHIRVRICLTGRRLYWFERSCIIYLSWSFRGISYQSYMSEDLFHDFSVQSLDLWMSRYLEGSARPPEDAE